MHCTQGKIYHGSVALAAAEQGLQGGVHPPGQASTSTQGLLTAPAIRRAVLPFNICIRATRPSPVRAHHHGLSRLHPCSKEDFIKASGHGHTVQWSSAERLGWVLSSQHHSWSRATAHCCSRGCADELAHTTPSPKPSPLLGLQNLAQDPGSQALGSTEFTLLLMKLPLWE